MSPAVLQYEEATEPNEESSSFSAGASAQDEVAANGSPERDPGRMGHKSDHILTEQDVARPPQAADGVTGNANPSHKAETSDGFTHILRVTAKV
jgi:hypothetical protein